MPFECRRGRDGLDASVAEICLIPERPSHRGSYSVSATLSCSNADCVFDAVHEYLTVPNSSCMSGLLNGFDRAVEHAVVQDDFDFHFRQKIDNIFGAAIQFGVAFLPSETFRFG